ncbi:hypothetical protein CLOP_g4064 [Closterium sp. NIES-67]|nr:hypothetical protein CLOP_g4064 [Closterium sp. NIES-67]
MSSNSTVTAPSNSESPGLKRSSSNGKLNGGDMLLLHFLLASFLGCIAVFPPKHLMVLPVLWRSFIGASLIIVSLASFFLLLSNGQSTAAVDNAGEKICPTDEPCLLDGSIARAVETMQAASKNEGAALGLQHCGIQESREGLDVFAVPVLLAVFGISVMANSDPRRVALILLFLGLLLKGGVLLVKGLSALSTLKIGHKPAWWLWVANVLKAREEWDKLRYGIH